MKVIVPPLLLVATCATLLPLCSKLAERSACVG